MKDRNRALNGDIVVVSICPRRDWKVCTWMWVLLIKDFMVSYYSSYFVIIVVTTVYL